jgi:hypothetical protein
MPRWRNRAPRLAAASPDAQIMEALGLFDEDVALAAQMRAAAAGGGKAGDGGKGKASRKRAADSSPPAPQRRSQRVAGVVRARRYARRAVWRR